MITKQIFVLICSCLLTALFMYSGAVKLIDAAAFAGSVKLQPLPALMKELLIAFLPATEIITALLLAFDKTRLVGLCSSFVLMAVFTGYTVMALSGYFKNVPCACMGLVKNLTWNEHLGFNLFFMVVSVVGLNVEWREKSYVEC